MARILWGIFFICALTMADTAALLAQSVPPKADNRPNVVIINVDDLGFGDLGSYGAKLVKTPNIDRLVNEGLSFTDAHSASAVCSPSRYALLTGEYPFRRKLWSPIFVQHRLVVDTSTTTIASILQRVGYATAAIGKWHLGFGNKEPVDWNAPLRPGPLELGFDYYFGVPVLNSHPPFVLVENDQVVGRTDNDPMVYGETADTRYFDEKFDYDVIGGARAAHEAYRDREIGSILTDRALDWLSQNRDGPFFLYFATTNIHHPFTPAARFVGTSRAGAYGDSIHELDWMVGRVLDYLDREGLADNTLVLLTSDNGGMLNRGGQVAWETGHRPNGPLLGFKFGIWEGGHRIPFIVRWPGQIRPGAVSDALISNVDLLATLAELTGQQLGRSERKDSISILPLLKSNGTGSVRKTLLLAPASRRHLAVRHENWIYIPARGEGGFAGQRLGDHTFGGSAALGFTKQTNSEFVDGRIKEDAAPAQLYDLARDISQTENLYNARPDIVRKLSMILREETATEIDD